MCNPFFLHKAITIVAAPSPKSGHGRRRIGARSVSEKRVDICTAEKQVQRRGKREGRSQLRPGARCLPARAAASLPCPENSAGSATLSKDRRRPANPAGSLTLTGARRRVTLTCPGNPAGSLMLTGARRRRALSCPGRRPRSPRLRPATRRPLHGEGVPPLAARRRHHSSGGLAACAPPAHPPRWAWPCRQRTTAGCATLPLAE